MLHMQKVTVNDLAALPAPEVLGPRHCPLPHYQFTRVIDNSLADHGLEVVHRDIEISHGGNRIFGTYRLQAPPEIRSQSDAVAGGGLTPMIGFKNSLDQVFRGRVALAGQVFNCSNGCWFMEAGFEVKRKNTTKILTSLAELMQNMVRDYWDKFIQVIAKTQELSQERLHDREAHHLICQATRKGITAHAHAGRVLDAWHDAPFDWGPKSLWRLHNDFTYVLDREVDNPYVRSQRNLGLNALINDHRTVTSHTATN